jgi:chromosome segregation ATPase
MTNNLTSKYEDERLRAAEQSQMVYLQNQIDDLRRMIKEQTNKYQWAVEQVRRIEATVTQIDSVVVRQHQEVVQSIDSFRRDIISLRKEVASALVKVDEGQKPLREIQAQIQQLSEVRKQDRDTVAGWLVRIEDLEQRTRHWQSQVNELDDRYRQIAGRFDSLYTADDDVKVEIRKVAEDLQIEKQSLRRQVIEGQQMITGLSGVLDEYNSRIIRLNEMRAQTEGFVASLPEQITTVGSRLDTLIDEVKRIERAASERFLMSQERIEDLRHQHDERIIVLQDSDDLQKRQFTAWLERIDGMVRELEQRLNRTALRIEHVYHEHAAELVVLERRDVELVDALLNTIRERSEKIHLEKVERGSPTE